MGHVSINIYKLGKDQLADYVLESEARYVMERITQVARTAKEIELEDRGSNNIKIIYHAVNDSSSYYVIDDVTPKYYTFADIDAWETRIFVAHQKSGSDHTNLYTERQDNVYTNVVHHKAGEEEDIYYTLELKQYRPYGVKTVTKSLSGLAAARAVSPTTSSTSNSNRTYTVVSGDCLWNITKYYTGDGSRWPELYELNTGIVGSNPNLIYPGQVLTLPTGW